MYRINAMKLTEKETKGFKEIIKDALDGMGGSQPKDLHEDNYSWHNHTMIQRAGYSENQSKGILSALLDKGLIAWSDDGEFPYTVTEEGIDVAQELYGV